MCSVYYRLLTNQGPDWSGSRLILILQPPDQSGRAWVQSDIRLINKTAAWFQYGDFLIVMAVPDFNQAAAWSIRQLSNFNLAIACCHCLLVIPLSNPLKYKRTLKYVRGSKGVSKSNILVKNFQKFRWFAWLPDLPDQARRCAYFPKQDNKSCSGKSGTPSQPVTSWPDNLGETFHPDQSCAGKWSKPPSLINPAQETSVSRQMKEICEKLFSFLFAALQLKKPNKYIFLQTIYIRFGWHNVPYHPDQNEVGLQQIMHRSICI